MTRKKRHTISLATLILAVLALIISGQFTPSGSNLFSYLLGSTDTEFVEAPQVRLEEDEVVFNDKTYTIAEVDGGNRSGDRLPNTAVDIGFGDRQYWAFTNDYGQLVYVYAERIILQDDDKEPVLDSGRYYPDEANVPGTEFPDLDQGHVIM